MWSSISARHDCKLFLVPQQALKKVSKFVRTNILPGAIAEVGLLCCACVHTNPEEAVTHLVEPTLLSVISSLKGIPATGFGGRGISEASVSTKVLSVLVIIILFYTALRFPIQTLNWFLSRQNPQFLQLLKLQLIISSKYYQLLSVMEALHSYAIKITSKKPSFLLLSAPLGRLLFLTLHSMLPCNLNTSPGHVCLDGSLTAKLNCQMV